MTSLTAQGITVRFGGHTALDDVSVDAPVGRITGLIGPNGAGKTTMFNVCSGYQVPVAGSVTLAERDITRVSAAERARAGLGRTFQRMQLFGSLTVRENVELAADSLHITDDPTSMLGIRLGRRRQRAENREEAERLLEIVGLSGLADRPASQLSTGQGRLLELARALARRPSLLLLDEPSSGLDGTETARFGRILSEVVESSGLGILLVEHDMSLVLDICAHLFVLDFGKALFEGTPDEVRSSDVVRAAYLGREADADAAPKKPKRAASTRSTPPRTPRRTQENRS